MRLVAFAVLAACAHPPPASPAAARPAAGPEWALLRPLLGTWEGSDPARHQTGRFSLAPDLGGKVLVRHNADDSPQGHHEDLMIVFQSPGGPRAAYYDNEGHVIHYGITADGPKIVMLSDEASGMPRFRLTYDTHDANALAIDFEIAPPGSATFQHYTGGVVHRVGDGFK